MIKQLRIAAVVASSVFAAGQAAAQAVCPAGTTRVGGNLINLLTNKTMCATRGADRWQEYHQTGVGGALIDYKLGPGHPVDPTDPVGTWTAQNGNDATVTHNYSGGSAFTWIMCEVNATPGTYTMVSNGAAGTITGVTLLAGQVACPGAGTAKRTR